MEEYNARGQMVREIKKNRVCELEILNGEPKEKYSMKTREHIVYTEEPGGSIFVTLSRSMGLEELLLMTLLMFCQNMVPRKQSSQLLLMVLIPTQVGRMV